MYCNRCGQPSYTRDRGEEICRPCHFRKVNPPKGYHQMVIDWKSENSSLTNLELATMLMTYSGMSLEICSGVVTEALESTL